MNTICLVQGGSFLLGIDAGDIVGRTSAGAIPPSGRARTVDLGALLTCKAGRNMPPDAPCLELRGHDETFFLLVDHIGEEMEAAAPPAPLPPASPALAARLCPQAAVCGTAAVPLLDPAQVIPVCAQLGKGIGLIAEEEPEPPTEPETEPAEPEPPPSAVPEALPAEPESAPEANREEDGADVLLAEEHELALTEESGLTETAPDAEPAAEQAAQAGENEAAEFLGAEEHAPLSEETASSEGEGGRTETASEPEPAVAAAAEEMPPPAAAAAAAAEAEKQPLAAAHQEQHEKTAAAIDEETFKQVMTWTIGRFKQSRAEEELQLGVDQLPPELAEMVRQKGLGRNVIQYLIDQIVHRCQESVQRKTPGEQHGG